MVSIKEGYMPFNEYKTYYRVAGECQPGKTPLLLIHGGPGSTHNYFELFDCLAEDGRAIISYDQLGCGLSSMPDRAELWTMRTWLDELEALRCYLHLDRVHLLGQSWGGMIVIQYMCDESPEGVASIILSSSVPSVKLWEQEARRNIRFLPAEYQEALARAEADGNYEDPAFREAMMAYIKRHCFDQEQGELPECVLRKKNFGRQAFNTAWGYLDYKAVGNLKDFEYLDKLRTVSTPSLIISGVDDECTPLVAKSMYDRLPDPQWELFAFSKHMPFLTEHDKYMQLLRSWLSDKD